MEKINLRFAVFVFMFSGSIAFSQNVETDISACKNTLLIFEQLSSDIPKETVESTIDSILHTKPYRVMFQHYNRDWRPNHLPEDVFKRMILSLKFPNEYKHGENQRADAMLKYWKQAYENLDDFKQKIRFLENANLSELIQKGVSNAQNWLPTSMNIPDFYFFVHPNGGSSAFAIDGNQGYDFFQLGKTTDGSIELQSLINTISHESHHLGLKVSQPRFYTKKDSLAYNYLLTFVAEGTATKFVDKYPGGVIDKIGEGNSKNFGRRSKKIWEEYTLHEEEIFKAFENDLENIYSGAYTMDSIQYRMLNYWLSGHKGRAYFLGSELFGAIYMAFGKETLFYTMENPRYLLKNYNKAIIKLDKRLKKKILLSQWLVEIL